MEKSALIFVSPARAARLIGVSRASIFRWIKAGKIRAIRLGDRAVRVAVPREIAEGAWAANESAAERAR